MDRITGLPAHPLVVHVPVALLPLSVVGVVVMLVRHAWYLRYRWAVLAVTAIGTVGAILATSTGEGLEEAIGAAEGRAAARAVHDHAQAGELARTAAILYFVVLALWVLVPWFLERRADRTATLAVGAAPASTSSGPRWLRPALMVGVALTAVASMVTIIEAGHSGASKAWEEFDTTPAAVRDD